MTPLLIKIAPDLGEGELEDIAEIASGGLVDGVIVSNTTISRPPLRSAEHRQRGGLSGKPLFELSTRMLARLYLLTGGRLKLIGVGGISDGESALAKIEAGASLIQLYTALVYRGPALIDEILDALRQKLAASGLSSIVDVTGRRAKEIAHQGLSGT
jgi:dihydroorotate dehydrogenase